MLQNVCLLVINGVNPSTANLPNDFPTFHPLYLSRFTPTRTNHPPSQDGFPHLHNSLIEAWILLFFLDFSYQTFSPIFIIIIITIISAYLTIISQFLQKIPLQYLNYQRACSRNTKANYINPKKRKKFIATFMMAVNLPRSNRPSRGGRLRIEEENPLPPLSLSSGLRIGFAFGDRVHVWLLIASDERLRSTRRERNRDGHIRCTYTHVHVHIRI